jgi:hypothetical protein
MTNEHGSAVPRLHRRESSLKGPQPIVDVFEIEFLDGGVEVFAFMFG